MAAAGPRRGFGAEVRRRERGCHRVQLVAQVLLADLPRCPGVSARSFRVACCIAAAMPGVRGSGVGIRPNADPSRPAAQHTITTTTITITITITVAFLISKQTSQRQLEPWPDLRGLYQSTAFDVLAPSQHMDAKFTKETIA